jgi:hypothetical protein
MKILWIEDFGDVRQISDFASNLFKDLLSKDVFDYYNSDKPIDSELKKVFSLSADNRYEIEICKNFQEWELNYKENFSEFDIFIIDINLSKGLPENYKLPASVEKFPDFHRKAGFYIYFQLIKKSVSQNRIAFLTGEEPSLKEFEDECNKILLDKPVNTFEKKDLGYANFRAWLKSCSENPYIQLRRGLLKGFDFVNAYISSLNDQELIEYNFLYKITEEPTNIANLVEKRQYLIELFKSMKDQTIYWIEENKSSLYEKIFNDIVIEWEKTRREFSIVEISVQDELDRQENIRWTLKKLRNWKSHFTLFKNFNEMDLAFIFIIAVRQIIFSQKDFEEHEKYLVSSFFDISNPAESDIDSFLINSMSDARSFSSQISCNNQSITYKALMNNLNEYLRNQGNPNYKLEFIKISKKVMYSNFVHSALNTIIELDNSVKRSSISSQKNYYNDLIKGLVNAKGFL